MDWGLRLLHQNKNWLKHVLKLLRFHGFIYFEILFAITLSYQFLPSNLPFPDSYFSYMFNKINIVNRRIEGLRVLNQSLKIFAVKIPNLRFFYYLYVLEYL